MYERLLKDQMIKFFDKKVSNLLSAFREGYSTQHSLIRVIEKWRKCLDSTGIVGTILMDLSKAFDCLPHDLLIAKLETYGFSANTLCLIYSRVHTTQTSPGSAQVFENLGLTHASVDAKNLGLA